MATIALEGTGAAIAFGTSTVTADLVSLTMPEQVKEALDTTHLGTTNAKTSKPGKLKDPGQWEAEFDLDPDEARLIDVAAAETITVTFPLEPGQSTGAQVAFSGYVVSEGGGEMTVDGLIRRKRTIQQTGQETWTPGS